MKTKRSALKIVMCISILLIFFVRFSEKNINADEEIKYKIKVNIAGNYVAVYKLDNFNTPEKIFTCSSVESIIVPSVIYKIEKKEAWAERSDKTYAKNVTVLNDGLCISSVPYSSNSDDTLLYGIFNKLGEEHSKENILLNCKDSKWIYDNCAVGTEVEIFSDNNANDINLKPATINILEDSENKNWDPTDLSESNPWKESGARIEGAKNLYVKEGEHINALQNLKGYDTCGNDISNKIILMGNYDYNKAGEYKVSYYLEDAIGSSAISEIKIIVTENEEERKTASGGEINNKDNKNVNEKSRTEKIKILIIIGVGTFLGAIILIKRSQK